MACFSFVPAQCSSVKPWNRWSPLRRLFPCQKSSVRAQAGSLFQCSWLQKLAEDHASSIPLIRSVLQGCSCALRLGTKLSDLEKHLQQHLFCSELKSVPLPTWSMVQDPRWWLYTLPWRNWCPEKDKFLRKDQQNYCYEAYNTSGWEFLSVLQLMGVEACLVTSGKLEL